VTAAQKRRRVDDYADQLELPFLVADGFDGAIVGVVELFTTAGHLQVICYDREACLRILVRRDRMSREDAEEYFTFNVEGAYVGEYTPAFLTRVEHMAA
jgi:hypothetical protein